MWEYFETRDVISGNLTQIIFIWAISGESSFGPPISLDIGCSEDNFLLMNANWRSFIALESSIAVTHGIDSQNAQTMGWGLLSSGIGTYLENQAARNFVDSMLGAEQLLLSVASTQGSSLTATFEITGLEEAIKPILEACRS